MNDKTSRYDDVSAVVLAGGRATRMGGIDKGLVTVLDRPMVAYAVAALSQQASSVLINANRNQSAYQRYAATVVADESAGGEHDFKGPLAGMLAAMQHTPTRYLVTAPCDSPLIPADLVSRLYQARQRANEPIAVAHDGERLQPVFCLLDTQLLSELRAFLAAGERKIDRFFAKVGYTTADFSDYPDAFLNINTEDDRLKLEQMLTPAHTDSKSHGCPPVLGFAAYSGAGKTTLLKRVIPALRDSGLRIGVIKHAHHTFDVDVPGKDSHTLRSAGADQIIVSSKQRHAWIVEHATEQEPTLQDLIAHLSDQPIDLIIVEGYKKAPIQKIEVHRPSLGKRLIAGDGSGVIAVATDAPVTSELRVPQLDLNAPDQVAQFIIDWLRGERVS